MAIRRTCNSSTSRLTLVLLGCALGLASACAPTDPEIVAIEYARATRTAASDAAVALLDIDSIYDRVQREIVLVNTEGDADRFLRDSITTLLWGLFQETPRKEDLAYDATPAQVEGDRAQVRVTMTDAAGQARERTVYLRRTADGWRVSDRSVDDLVSYLIQRLEERY